MKKSRVFTGNDLGRLGNVTSLPSTKDVKGFGESIKPLAFTQKKWKDALVNKNYKDLFRLALDAKQSKKKESSSFIEQAAKAALEKNDMTFAWKAALYSQL